MQSQKYGAIKNPLTIVAIFAAIAEISGTVVLIGLPEKSQDVFMWFVMLFPVLLILLFFGTLNWNHRVLYAPSDFVNEGHFVTLITKATSIEVLAKRSDDADVVQPPATIEEETKLVVTKGIRTTDEAHTPKEALAAPDGFPAIKEPGKRARPNLNGGVASHHLQRAAINQAAADFPEYAFESDVKIGAAPYIYDAISSTDKDVIVWESILVSDVQTAQDNFTQFLQHARRAQTEIVRTSRSFTLGAIVTYAADTPHNIARNCTIVLEQLLHASGVAGVIVEKPMSAIWDQAKALIDNVSRG